VISLKKGEALVQRHGVESAAHHLRPKLFACASNHMSRSTLSSRRGGGGKVWVSARSPTF